ncbi:hypothetical protein SAMN05428953_12124 [Mesorhizobium muleiense]|uniref:Uncharacterized protein n=1 Tax=Mesorhizobium muleiense TaxID=1004279 RepID=A0A1G9EYE8_9HYPH|nr:hypothetical protein SAMN05428953_12124 [Mesorhizobium muleiense]
MMNIDGLAEQPGRIAHPTILHVSGQDDEVGQGLLYKSSSQCSCSALFSAVTFR